METQILQKWQIRKIKAIFFLFVGNSKKKKKKVKNNVALVPKSRKRYLGMTLEVKNGFVLQELVITSGKKQNKKNPVKVALLVFDTVTEIHWNIGKRKRSFTKKLGLKSSALVDLGEQESSYWNAAGCCWLNWELGRAWAGGPLSPRSWPSAAPAWRCARPGWRSCP